jgi:hypothetical protein
MPFMLSYAGAPAPGSDRPSDVTVERFATKAQALGRARQLLERGEAYHPEIADESTPTALTTRDIVEALGIGG